MNVSDFLQSMNIQKKNNNKMFCILMWCIIIMNLTCSLMILVYKLISNDLGMNIKL